MRLFDPSGPRIRTAVLIGAFATASLIARLALGRVQNRFGDNIVVYPLFAAMLLIYVAPSPWTIISRHPLQHRLRHAHALDPSDQHPPCRPARFGVATFSYFFTLDIGFGLGPIVLGAIIAASSYIAMYAVAALLVGLGAVLYWLFHGRLTAPEAGEGLV